LTTWRIVFMGTPAFACPSLEALLTSGDQVAAVVCQPDRPRGRGLEVLAPETKRLAERHGIPVLQPTRLRDPAFAQGLRAFAPDLAVVAAYGRILPREILEIPAHGCVNVHASLLPRHRGAAPVQWSIMAGDTETGITIMQMDEGLDAGDVILQERLAIRPDHTGGALLGEMAALGARTLLAAIEGLKAGRLAARPQPAAGVTLAPRIERAHCLVDWERPAVELERLVRALAPAPSAFTTLHGKLLKIHRVAIEPGPERDAAPPGTIVRADAGGFVVQAGGAALRLLEVQLEGRKSLPFNAFLAGIRLHPGSFLGRA
jgi:methionyl-tRNA formyltransferase